MAGNPSDDKGFSLRRWSQRKHGARHAHRGDAASRGIVQSAAAASTGAATAAAAPGVPVAAEAAPGTGTQQGALTQARADAAWQPAHAANAPLRDAPGARASLPPVDSLGIDSDFTAFMQPGVDESLKRGALKKLFSDPRFNVMDGLDVYIDDYSKPDPLDPAIVRTLAQARYIFNPPPTRVTAEGYVEDVPENELRAGAREPGSEAAAEPTPAERDAAAALPDAPLHAADPVASASPPAAAAADIEPALRSTTGPEST